MNRDELPNDIHERLTALSDQGSAFFDALDFAQARAKYQDAWALVPEPKTKWNASFWLLAAIGDCDFYLGDFGRACTSLGEALTCPGAVGSAFVHLRLGQAHYELGELDRAADELIRAYVVEGPEVFADQDPKYLAFLATRADLTSHRS